MIKSIVAAFIILFSTISLAYSPTNMGCGTDTATCGQASDTLIVGKSTHDGVSALALSSIRCSQFTSIADTCSVDTIRFYAEGHVTGETATVGVYSISGDTGTKIMDSAAIDGDGDSAWEDAALDSTTDPLSPSTDYALCIGSKGSAGFNTDTENTGSGWSKTISGETWDAGTLPATLDFSSPTAGWQAGLYAINP